MVAFLEKPLTVRGLAMLIVSRVIYSRLSHFILSLSLSLQAVFARFFSRLSCSRCTLINDKSLKPQSLIDGRKMDVPSTYCFRVSGLGGVI